MLRVGQIPYLNCEPFFAHLDGVETVPLTPRALGRAMAAGTLDAGPLSLVDALGLGDAVRRLPFGIATRGAVYSVLVFSRKPLGELSGGVVSVTDETVTSVRILRVLLEQRYGLRGLRWHGPGGEADARLLIGDEALRARADRAGFAHVTDVAAEWTAWTGLPCVFASWALRRGMPDAEARAFEAALDGALVRGLARLDAIAARRTDTGLDGPGVVRYLENFTYRFGPVEEAAIAELGRRFAA